MSRTLTALLVLLGLGLGSCSSSPSSTELGINPDVDTSHFNPRPRGMHGSGVAFDKYFLASEEIGPAHRDTWYHIFTPWNWGEQSSFGNVTKRTNRSRTSSIERDNGFYEFYSWAMNENANDPYND